MGDMKLSLAAAVNVGYEPGYFQLDAAVGDEVRLDNAELSWPYDTVRVVLKSTHDVALYRRRCEVIRKKMGV